MQNINISVAEAKAVAFDCISSAVSYYKSKNDFEAIFATFVAIDNYLAAIVDECKRKRTENAVIKEVYDCCKHKAESMISSKEINNVFGEK